MEIRCDKAMRRSKERGYLQENVRWECTHNCSSCHCALVKQPDGTEVHLSKMQQKKTNVGGDDE